MHHLSQIGNSFTVTFHIVQWTINMVNIGFVGEELIWPLAAALCVKSTKNQPSGQTHLQNSRQLVEMAVSAQQWQWTMYIVNV